MLTQIVARTVAPERVEQVDRSSTAAQRGEKQVTFSLASGQPGKARLLHAALCQVNAFIR